MVKCYYMNYSFCAFCATGGAGDDGVAPCVCTVDDGCVDGAGGATGGSAVGSTGFPMRRGRLEYLALILVWFQTMYLVL